MKPLLSLLLTALIASNSPAALIDDARRLGRSQIGVRIEYYQHDHGALNNLLATPTDQTDATPIRAKLAELITKNRARRLHTTTLTTRSGHRARSESSRTHTYPTEITVGSTRANLTGPIAPDAEIITPAYYSAFETRNLGPLFEIDPVIAPDDLTIDLNYDTRITELLATRQIGQHMSAVEQPIFYTVRCNSAATLHSGTSLLVAMHTPKPKDPLASNLSSNKRILTILTAHIQN